ncbi:hypothetical protein LIA77_09848 [Sarocladium implicatum]|nr:hypothetical protein LIA77_09848 [Sarocladium implicatum]
MRVYEHANKGWADGSGLPSPECHHHPDVLVPSVEDSVVRSLDSEDCIYGYPELEDDIASIFDISSSLNCSGSVGLPSQESYDLSCPSDMRDVESTFDLLTQSPSSLIRDHEALSPTREDFDPALQYCSKSKNERSNDDQCCDEMNAPHKDIDEDMMLQAFKPSAWTVSSFAASFASATSRSAARYPPYGALLSGAPQTPSPSARVSPQQVSPAKSLLLRPFKTFFRIDDMLVHKADLYRHQPNAIFELFARVVYTSRNKTGCRQYFQLRNLSSQTPPFLSGTLVD